jgi:hypothetical protein
MMSVSAMSAVALPRTMPFMAAVSSVAFLRRIPVFLAFVTFLAAMALDGAFTAFVRALTPVTLVLFLIVVAVMTAVSVRTSVALLVAGASLAPMHAVPFVRALPCGHPVASPVLVSAVRLVILMGVVTAAVTGLALVLQMSGVLMDGVVLVLGMIGWVVVTAHALHVVGGVVDHVVRGMSAVGLVVVGVALVSPAMRARRPTDVHARPRTAWSLRALERGIGQQCARPVELPVRFGGCTDVYPGARGRHLLPDALDDGLEPGTG